MFLIVYNSFDLLPQLRTWKRATALQAGAVVVQGKARFVGTGNIFLLDQLLWLEKIDSFQECKALCRSEMEAANFKDKCK